jgi:hypothetical protein
MDGERTDLDLDRKVLQAGGDEQLKGTKYLWLANEENVPEWRRAEFQALKRVEASAWTGGPTTTYRGHPL